MLRYELSPVYLYISKFPRRAAHSAEIAHAHIASSQPASYIAYRRGVSGGGGGIGVFEHPPQRPLQSTYDSLHDTVQLAPAPSEKTIIGAASSIVRKWYVKNALMLNT